jgi:hypothetical protein
MANNKIICTSADDYINLAKKLSGKVLDCSDISERITKLDYLLEITRAIQSKLEIELAITWEQLRTAPGASRKISTDIEKSTDT